MFFVVGIVVGVVVVLMFVIDVVVIVFRRSYLLVEFLLLVFCRC